MLNCNYKKTSKNILKNRLRMYTFRLEILVIFISRRCHQPQTSRQQCNSNYCQELSVLEPVSNHLFLHCVHCCKEIYSCALETAGAWLEYSFQNSNFQNTKKSRIKDFMGIKNCTIDFCRFATVSSHMTQMHYTSTDLKLTKHSRNIPLWGTDRHCILRVSI